MNSPGTCSGTLCCKPGSGTRSTLCKCKHFEGTMWSLWGMNQLSWVLSVYSPINQNCLLQKDSLLLKEKYLGEDPG